MLFLHCPQMNQATHFLDGSHIYGSNSRDAAALREKTGGLLKTVVIDDEELLPLAANPIENCLVDSNSATCFNSGKFSFISYCFKSTTETERGCSEMLHSLFVF